MSQDNAMEHLGNVLLMLADLHEDDRCDAFVQALEFYNKENPEAQIQPMPGYVTRLQEETPLSRVIAKIQVGK